MRNLYSPLVLVWGQGQNLADKVTIDPNPRKSHPPSEFWPFTTTEFKLTLSVANKEFNYTVPITQFYESDNKVYAEFIFNEKLHNIIIHQNLGREYVNFSWCVKNETPSVSSFNEKINLDGYLSVYSAWYELGYLLEKNNSAWYFMTSVNKDTTSFKIPGFQSFEYEGSVLTITRDTSNLLVNSHQIELLKNSNVEWYLKLGHQLENPQWKYDFQRPIESIVVAESEKDSQLQVFVKTIVTPAASFF